VAVILSVRPLCADEPVDYLRNVKPVLQERCYACHGALKQESALRLDTAAAIQQGGNSGPAIVPGKVDESRLIERVTAEDADYRMPPEGKPLSAAEIAHLKQWIAEGAPHSDDETPEEDPLAHWAFQPIVRPAVPRVNDADWSRNPIDAFLAEGHEREGLRPVPVADKRLLARRLYLDLTGFPPTLAEVQQFLRDERPDAYDRLVDSLLNSPAYGERWARHWMDVWRYSEWHGFMDEVRYGQKHIWHWRDWIIDSLNADKGYDQMIREMLAADELYPTDADALRATGFLVRNFFLFNRTTWLDQTIEHTSKAFLGLTMNCCKCHDHKYDPFSQRDYYRLRAVFEPHQVRLDPVPGVIDLDADGLPRAFDADLERPTYLHVRGNEKEPDTSEAIAPGVPAVFTFDEYSATQVSLPPDAHFPALQKFVLDDHLREAEQAVADTRLDLDNARKQLAEIAVFPPAAEAAASRALISPLLRDDFDEARRDLWEFGVGDWGLEGGYLTQSRSTATRCSIRTRKTYPADFQLVLDVEPSNGNIWKTFGIAFDVVDGREKLVRMSALSFVRLLQISYMKENRHVEPRAAEARVHFNLNKRHVVVLSVRDRLVNVRLHSADENEDKPTFAYELPVPREPGKIELVTYDLRANIDWVEIRPLPPDVPLVRPDGMTDLPTDLERAEARVTAIEAKLAAAEARLPALRSAHAVAAARHRPTGRENLAELVNSAARCWGVLRLAEATADVARAEFQMLVAESEYQMSDIQDDLQDAREQLAEVTESLKEPSDTFMPIRASLKGEACLDEPPAERHKPYPQTSTGRRAALARWIVHPENPLPARVAVNHIWLRHFGQPLVPSVDDFGRRAKRPRQEELLDWLADELMANGWRMKPLHRLIVTSRAYLLSSAIDQADPATRQRDPENVFYWRRVPVRMEAQVIRDSLLHLSGNVQSRLGGPSLNPHYDDGQRRSLYFARSPNAMHAFLKMFDDADIVACYRRTESVVPQQALTLANSKFSIAMARDVTARIQARVGHVTDEEFVQAAYETILCISPTEEELTACLETLRAMRAFLKSQDAPTAKQLANENLVHVLFNHNDFVTIR
jgi:hypothetical protein